MGTAGALIQMTSHGGGAAALDGDEHLQVQPGEPGGRAVCESMACGGYDIGQLQERPCHSLLAARAFRVRGCRQRE